MCDSSILKRFTINRAANRLSDAANSAVCLIPSKSISANSATRAPATAPIVFHPYSRPSAEENDLSSPYRPLSRTGRVVPMAMAGTSRTLKATVKRITLSSPCCSVTCASMRDTNGAMIGSSNTAATPEAAMVTSTTA